MGSFLFSEYGRDDHEEAISVAANLAIQRKKAMLLPKAWFAIVFHCAESPPRV
jgi:hypothetical protein